jgi:hypothetical protein
MLAAEPCNGWRGSTTGLITHGLKREVTIHQAFRIWPHIPLASPRFFAHHTGRYHPLALLYP